MSSPAVVADLLARRALSPTTPEDVDALRTLTLTNLAAAIGERGAIGAVTDGLPLASTGPGGEAFLLAAQLHARTQDDFYPDGRVHVGAIALAATLALADRVGDRLFASLAAGYRAMCDVSGAYSATAQERGLRPSGVFGPIGSAAAASVALGLTEAQTANAIALAAAAAGGHNHAWVAGSDEWILEVGAAARAGVEAALFTLGGARAGSDAFEGRAGWSEAFFGQSGAADLLARLQGPVVGPSAVAVKPYPVSGIAQVPTELACRAHERLAGRTPRGVTVAMSSFEYAYPGSSNTGPFASRSDALMSVAFCVAGGLLDGTVRLERLEKPNDADIAVLLERLIVQPDPALAENVAQLRVTLEDGEEIVATIGAEEILYPGWAELAAAAPALALRSEAPEPAVAGLVAELAKDMPSAVVLHQNLRSVRKVVS